MYTLTIKVTKEILQRAKFCGTAFAEGLVSQNCAVALAVRDIFPNISVVHSHITIYHHTFGKWGYKMISLPPEVEPYILNFDKAAPEERENLPEISFDIEISDVIIDTINIEEVKQLLTNHPTLELHEA